MLVSAVSPVIYIRQLWMAKAPARGNPVLVPFLLRALSFVLVPERTGTKEVVLYDDVAGATPPQADPHQSLKPTRIAAPPAFLVLGCPESREMRLRSQSAF